MKFSFKLVLFVSLLVTNLVPAEACRMRLLEGSRAEFSAAMDYVITQIPEQLRSIHEITKTYHGHRGHVVEVVAMDEAGSCKAYVLDVAVTNDCKFQVSERPGNFSCL